MVFSLPEYEREKRHEIRSSLTRLGPGTVATGVWIAPGNLASETWQTLERRGLSPYVDIFAGDHLAFGDLRSKVRGAGVGADALAAPVRLGDLIGEVGVLGALATPASWPTRGASTASPKFEIYGEQYGIAATIWRALGR